MALPDRMSLRPFLLWLTLNLALLVQCLSRNTIFCPYYIPRKMLSPTPRAMPLQIVKVKVTLRPTISRPSWCQTPSWDPVTIFLSP
jgi:hypothetical protein